MITFVALSNGCLLGPEYSEPPVQVEDTWVYHNNPHLRTEPPVDPVWWENAFSDPTLNDLVAFALQENLTLRAAALRTIQAQQQLAIAIGNQFPQSQQLTGLASRSRNAGVILEEYNVGFNLSWELDMWGRFRRQVEYAAAELSARAADYDGVLVSLVAQVAQTYILIRTTQARLSVAHRNIGLQEESLRIAQAKFQSGAVSGLDVAQAKTLLNNTKATVPDLESTLQQLKNTLATLLGVPPLTIGHLDGQEGKIPSPPAHVAIGMPQNLLRQRPDIRSSERRLAAQAAQIGIARTDLYPALSIGGSIGSQATSLGNLFEGESETWELLGGFQWNLFNYGRLRSNVRLQDARFQELLEQYRQTVIDAQTDAENAIVTYLKSFDRLTFLRRAARASRESVRLSTTQYTNGQIDFNTVITTLTADTQQQDILVQIQGAVAVNLVQVFLSLGGGWQVRADTTPDNLLPDPVKKEMHERTKYWKEIFR